MAKKLMGLCLLMVLMILLFDVASVSASSPAAKIVVGYFSNWVPIFMKWLWSFKASKKIAVSGRPMMKFENGYEVETVFDGSKLGIEPYSVEVLPDGELLILDSANSNLYKISDSLSLYSRPRLVAGSPDGYTGHVDGKNREAKLNHPKGLDVDGRGNIYIADTDNMVIRKISDGGVSTIAGGRLGRGGGHSDGPSEDAKFSNDFDVVYVGSSCSLLVIDRGKQAIREIQLHFDDCAYQYGSGFPLGIAILLAAGFLGYMLAMLQRRVGSVASSEDDPRTPKSASIVNHYQKPLKSVRPPLIPTEDKPEKLEEGFMGSLVKLLLNTGSSFAEILSGFFPGFRKGSQIINPYENQQLQYKQHLQKRPLNWQVQESYVIPDEDEPPSVESRTPTPRKTYPFMSKDPEKIHQIRQNRSCYKGWDEDVQQSKPPPPQQQHQQLQQQQQQQQRQQHHHRHLSSIPQTVFQQSYENNNNEIVFGAVQEQDLRFKSVVIKPIDYENLIYDPNNIRSRFNSTGYTNPYW